MVFIIISVLQYKFPESVTTTTKDTDVLNGKEDKFEIPSNNVNCAVIQPVEDLSFFLVSLLFVLVVCFVISMTLNCI